MKALLTAVLVFVACLPAAVAGPVRPQLRISLENAPTHVHTLAVTRFAQDLKQRLAGKIDIAVFANASLFRDRDIIQALAQDKVEMAVPGTWHIARFEPNASLFLLPVFYGRTSRASYQVLDSDIGRDINLKIETHLGLKIIGRWIDLGHAHIFGVNRKVRTLADLKDIRIRVAGGFANELRVAAFGARPSIIAWPDLPEHMQRNRVDAILTSYESIRSAKLWARGVTSVFEDMEYFPQYVPLIRESFWRKLSADIRQTIRQTWERHVDTARQMAATAQAEAKKTVLAHGVSVSVPSSKMLEETRARLMIHQDEFAKKTGIDPGLVRRVTAQLGALR